MKRGKNKSLLNSQQSMFFILFVLYSRGLVHHIHSKIKIKPRTIIKPVVHRAKHHNSRAVFDVLFTENGQLSGVKNTKDSQTSSLNFPSALVILIFPFVVFFQSQK